MTFFFRCGFGTLKVYFPVLYLSTAGRSVLGAAKTSLVLRSGMIVLPNKTTYPAHFLLVPNIPGSARNAEAIIAGSSFVAIFQDLACAGAGRFCAIPRSRSAAHDDTLQTEISAVGIDFHSTDDAHSPVAGSAPPRSFHRGSCWKLGLQCATVRSLAIVIYADCDFIVDRHRSRRGHRGSASLCLKGRNGPATIQPRSNQRADHKQHCCHPDIVGTSYTDRRGGEEEATHKSVQQ